MSNSFAPRRRRRLVVAAAGLALASIASAFGATPAGAVNAPLTTTDGLGVRLDENAILGPALELIEDELQPYVNQKIYEGALANSVMDDPDWVQGTANVELSFDFVNAGVAGYPQGGLKVHADLQNIMMRFYRYGEWWQPECQFRVNPDNGYIDASAKVNTALLPAAPLQLNPITAYWDNSPTITKEIGNSLCYGYLFDEWWDGLWGSGTDVADQLETELNAQAQDLVNDLWADNVAPVITSLNEFGITFSQVKTDDHGLIVKATMNASAGLTVPGFPGAKNVTNTEDSGATSNVDNLLAARSEITVTVHPNVVNQFMNALNQGLNGNFAAPAIAGAAVETYLLPPGSRGFYDDNSWSVTHTVGVPYFTKPTGTGGRPQVQMPQSTFSFYNADYVFGLIPLAVFNGQVNTANLSTEVRASGKFGPYIASSAATLSGMTFDALSSDPDVVTWNPSPSGVLTYAKQSIDQFSDVFLTDWVSLAPISVGGLAINLCGGCTRFSGDQRYTEYFTVA